LLHEKRGISDNKNQFGDITDDELQQWSNDLVVLQIEGMIKLINQHEDVLVWSKKWDAFQTIIQNYTQKVKNIVPHVRPGEVDKPRYKVLKQLSNEVWFDGSGPEADKQAAIAKGKFPRVQYLQRSSAQLDEILADHTSSIDRKPSIARFENPEQLAKEKQEGLFSRKDYPRLTDIAISKGLNKGDRIQTSEGKWFSQTPRSAGAWGTINEVIDHFKTYAKDEKIEVKWDDNLGGGFTYQSSCRIKAFQRQRNVRRRMAQREFSSRRDSPMVHLLEQIGANEKHNELN